jgi:hypothetical protein
MEHDKEIKHYKEQLPSIFRCLGIKGFVTVARWPFEEVKKDRVLVTIPVGELNCKEQDLVERARKHIKLEVLEKFSFTTLIRENGKPVWFRFKKASKNEIQVNKISTQKLLDISCSTSTVDDDFLLKLVETLEQIGLSQYGGKSITNEGLRQVMKDTFNSAVVGVLNEGIKHIYFVPVSSPLKREEILGILAINSIDEVKEDILVNVVAQVAMGMLFPFHMRELNQIRLSYALRSAVAAIMARNMSHNPGSHGLAYLIAEIEEKIRSGQALSVEEAKDLKNFLEYAKARMDFVAEVTTYWREVPWLEQLTL